MRQSGRLYEIPLLVALAAISVAIGAGQGSWLAGVAVFVGVPAALFALIGGLAAIGSLFLRLKRRGLVARLGDEQPEVRLEAARGLEKLAGEAASAAPSLVAALQDKDSRVRFAAARALVATRAPSAPAVPVLAEALEDPGNRDAAAETLATMGDAASAAVGALLRAFGDPSWSGRFSAAYALGRIGPEAREAVPVLTRALRDSNPSVAEWSANALGNIDADAVPAIGELAAAARHDSHSRVGVEAIEALGKIGTAAAAAALAPHLKDAEPWIRSRAAYALGEIGPDAAQSLRALEELATDPDEHVRRVATQAAKRIRA